MLHSSQHIMLATFVARCGSTVHKDEHAAANASVATCVPVLQHERQNVFSIENVFSASVATCVPVLQHERQNVFSIENVFSASVATCVPE
jgi:hypothetical protein